MGLFTQELIVLNGKRGRYSVIDDFKKGGLAYSDTRCEMKEYWILDCRIIPQFQMPKGFKWFIN